MDKLANGEEGSTEPKDIGTKKQKVDFINARCTIQGRSIPKNKLNMLSSADLMKIISSNNEIYALFKDYIAECERAKEISGKKNQNSIQQFMPESAEKIAKLQHLSEALVEDPNSFLNIMQLRDFLINLRFGEIPDNVLTDTVEKITDASPGLALSIMNFVIEQKNARS